jgi:hypothetical protein
VALQAQQIVTLACQTAKCPGYTSQAGQLLNSILQEVAQTYDIATGAKQTFRFNFNPGLIANVGNSIYGSGPYPLPTNYLRAIKGECFWTLNGVVYDMIPVDLDEFDHLVQQPGIQSYPYVFATDTSLEDVPYPCLYVYSPPSGAYPVTIRYYALPADIAAPETSASIPWFTYQAYLLRRLAGELMAITGDDRMDSFLGDSPAGAQGMLNRFLKLKDDNSNRPKRISLDRRSFGRNYNSLPNTKSIGW